MSARKFLMIHELTEKVNYSHMLQMNEIHNLNKKVNETRCSKKKSKQSVLAPKQIGKCTYSNKEVIYVLAKEL